MRAFVVGGLLLGASGCFFGGSSSDVCGEEVWYLDADGDGFATATSSATSCTALPGFVRDTHDCDPYNPAVSPVGPEVCGDGLDNVCGVVDSCGLQGEVGTATAMTNLVASLPSDEAGRALAVGHADADGVLDVYIGAPAYGDLSGGAVYVVLGGPKGQRLIQDEASTILVGAAGTGLGTALAAGDVDGDGLADVVAASAAGDVYVLWAGEGGGPVAAKNAHVLLTGEGLEGGVAALAAAELTGDGLADLAVGTDGLGVYVVSAPAAGTAALTDAAVAWGRDAFLGPGAERADRRYSNELGGKGVVTIA